MIIDFVLPWVNNQDKNWQDCKNRFDKKKSVSDSNHNSRYRDMGTLKYVLRSIEKNCPWYNKIYLITCGQYPEWLDLKSEKVIIVNHADIYDEPLHLPTFNSSSIEMSLPNIRSLSEHFIYLNDDTLFFSQLNKDRFFNNGLPVDFLCHGWIPRKGVFLNITGNDTWINSLNNNLELVNKFFSAKHLPDNVLYHSSYTFKDKVSNFLLNKIYNKFFWIEHWHHPIAYLKSTLLDVKDNCYNEMQICSANRFRNNTDLTQYLYRYWRLAKGDFYPHKYQDGFETNIESLKKLRESINYCNNKRPNFLCLNDSPSLSDQEFEDVKKELLEYLEKNFPEKASFEL